MGESVFSFIDNSLFIGADHMKRYAMKLAYDGSQFFGWQIQVQSPTVQEMIEKALLEITREKIIVIGSGRTDTGVHALGQVAHFDFPFAMTQRQILLAIRTKLPKSIQILDIQEVAPDFHARYDALDRTYQYILTSMQTPFNHKYKSHLPKYKIEFNKFIECIPYFIGEHDFTSFAKPNPDIKNHICNIKSIDITTDNIDIIIKIKANRFLHNMVRRIVGAMIAVSHKSLDPSIITEWINTKKHVQKNYITAPPNGLYLYKVEYENLSFL
jgi:tRNA pseudouridine38-40 synthase